MSLQDDLATRKLALELAERILRTAADIAKNERIGLQPAPTLPPVILPSPTPHTLSEQRARDAIELGRSRFYARSVPSHAPPSIEDAPTDGNSADTEF